MVDNMLLDGGIEEKNKNHMSNHSKSVVVRPFQKKEYMPSNHEGHVNTKKMERGKFDLTSS